MPCPRWIVAATGAVVALFSTSASADDDIHQPSPSDRRSGLVMAGTMGGALGRISGYPNEATKVDDYRYHASSGARAGSGGSFALMAALTDYFSIGLWFGSTTLYGPAMQGHSTGGGLRLEGFPLYASRYWARDFGLCARFGVGSTSLTQTGNVVAEGTQSFVAFGGFYEVRLVDQPGGVLALGPSVELEHVSSSSAYSLGALVGLRIAFYGHTRPLLLRPQRDIRTQARR